MKNDISAGAALDDMIAEAELGHSVYITRVHNLFENNPHGIDLKLVLDFAGGMASRSFPVRLPLPSELSHNQAELVHEYLCAVIYNLISTYGGSTLTFFRPLGISGLDELLDSAAAEFYSEKSKKERQGYGRCLNVAERTADALDGLAPGTVRFVFQKKDADGISNSHLIQMAVDTPETAGDAGSVIDRLKDLPERLSGKTILGLDIGGSDIKAVLAMDGRIIAYKEYDWFPARFTVSRQLADPVLLIARWARIRAAVEKTGLLQANEFIELRDLLDEVSSAEVSDEKLEMAVLEAEKRFCESANAPLPGLDAVGLCFPDVVVKNKIVGGEVYKTRGIRNNPAIEYEKDFRTLTDLDLRLAEFCIKTPDGAVVRNTNDGPMASFTSAVERAFSGEQEVNKGVFAHTLGTELGTGWLTAAAELPTIPLEVYNYVIDLGSRKERRYQSDDPRSLNNFNTGIPGTLQKYTSQSGVFRLAVKYFPEQRPDLYAELYNKGFIENKDNGEILICQNPRDMRKPLLEHLMALPEREGEDGVCGEIFREIGEYLAVTWDETRRILAPLAADRVLFGRLVKNPVCFRLMQEGAKRIAGDLQLVVADDESAWTPLMRQLRDDGRYTVAQFAQAVGAVYYALL